MTAWDRTEKRTERVTAKVRRSTLEQLYTHADLRGITRSVLIREALEEKVEALAAELLRAGAPQ